MAQFLHKKTDSSLWYYRRRYPQDVAKVIGKPTYMQSLKTSVKREAERLSRQVSVQFDTICLEARSAYDAVHASSQVLENAKGDSVASADAVLAGVPSLVRLAASRVVEEQQRNPKGWLAEVKRWQPFFEAMKAGAVPASAQRPAIEAQAILNGIELAIQAAPVPLDLSSSAIDPTQQGALGGESWPALCRRALALYQHKVGLARYKLAESKFLEVRVQSCAEHHIHEGLRTWCAARLNEVQPRTVKGQLDSMISALRCVMPKLQTPVLRELKGVMQPQSSDRQSMPVQRIREAISAFKNRPVSDRIRIGYGGGASQFDAIAVEALAVLGMRPRELIQARPSSIVSKEDVFGKKGLYLRIEGAKNKASEREIPLSDGVVEIVSLDQLRQMFEWQEKNPRSPHGTVASFGKRFRVMTSGYTLYQMRHSWKDIAVHAGVDFEIRERMLGHRVRGVAAVYGSGIPLDKGLKALHLIRNALEI